MGDVMAPGANLDIVEMTGIQLSDDITAIQTAAALPGVSVVSVSVGATEDGINQATYDSMLFPPTSHNGVTIVAASGDSGVSTYPAASPNVLAVGGTDLTLNPNNNSNAWYSETTWNTYSYNAPPAHPTGGASGGGQSLYEADTNPYNASYPNTPNISYPDYQTSVQLQTEHSATNARIGPDVAYNAEDDPNGTNNGASTYSVCDSYPGVSINNSGYVAGSSTQPWFSVGGTSAGAPQWSALIAIADQGLTIEKYGSSNSSTIYSLNGRTQTLPRIYSLPSTDFHDITSGNNYEPNNPNQTSYSSAAPGYDETTGRGSPIANKIVADLISPTMAFYQGSDGSQASDNITPNSTNTTVLPVNAASFSSEAVGHYGSTKSPVVFAIGSDGHLYYQKFNASGSPITGYLAVGVNITSFAIDYDNSGNPFLLMVGADGYGYTEDFDSNCIPLYGPNSFDSSVKITSVAAGHDSSGNPEAFFIGPLTGGSGNLYYQQFALGTVSGVSVQVPLPNGSPTAVTYGSGAKINLKAMSVASDVSGNPEVFLIGADGNGYSIDLNSSGTTITAGPTPISGSITGIAAWSKAVLILKCISLGRLPMAPELFTTRSSVLQQRLDRTL